MFYNFTFTTYDLDLTRLLRVRTASNRRHGRFMLYQSHVQSVGDYKRTWERLLTSLGHGVDDQMIKRQCLVMFAIITLVQYLGSTHGGGSCLVAHHDRPLRRTRLLAYCSESVHVKDPVP